MSGRFASANTAHSRNAELWYGNKNTTTCQLRTQKRTPIYRVEPCSETIKENSCNRRSYPLQTCLGRPDESPSYQVLRVPLCLLVESRRPSDLQEPLWADRNTVGSPRTSPAL